MPSQLLVISSRPVQNEGCSSKEEKDIELSDTEKARDAMDDFNHGRFRQALILRTLQNEEGRLASVKFYTPPPSAEAFSLLYKSVHSPGLLSFLECAWGRWEALGESGQDPIGFLSSASSSQHRKPPPFIPPCAPLPRFQYQRPSKHVLGQMGYYCTDTCTPVFDGLVEEIYQDGATILAAIEMISTTKHSVVYALTTHPGHHAAADSFGGYCYVNHIAALARGLQNKDKKSMLMAENNAANEQQKVAILDVDYHCGNGTASIFDEDPSVLVVSLHCHPDWDYPFHSGFQDETGNGAGIGSTMHLPLPPGTAWNAYTVALQSGLERIKSFGATAVLVSLGLDTYDQDPCAIRRAGFCLSGDDYIEMGRAIGTGVAAGVPIVFVQEGGYRMETIGQAAANVVFSCLDERQSQS